MRITVEMRGVEQVAASIERIGKAATNAPKSLMRQGQLTLTKAIGYCPMDTGVLRTSAAVKFVGDGIELSFSTDYAVYVHEDMYAHHPIGQAKYLEVAVQEDSKLFAAAIAKDMKP